MIFKQYKDGSCDIVFSWKERLILLRKGKLHLSQESLKNFTNNLAKIIFEFQNKFDEKTSNMFSNENSEIKGE
jgi:hypothetical protein